jgi:hypothetical protein
LLPVLLEVAVKVAVVWPARIVTVAGRLTWFVAADRLTVRFPVGAVARVTVPVVAVPPVIVLGERLSEAIESSTTVKIVFAEDCGFVAYRLSE